MRAYLLNLPELATQTNAARDGKAPTSYLLAWSEMDLPAAAAILLASCVGRALSSAGAEKVDQGVKA